MKVEISVPEVVEIFKERSIIAMAEQIKQGFLSLASETQDGG